MFQGDQSADLADALGGDDQLFGGGGDDVLLGGDGDDLLHGENQSDTLDDGAGDDQLYGGNQDDVLISGGGSDFMDGGKQNDAFFFTGAQDGDVITVDGGSGTDRIDLSEYTNDKITDNGSTISVDLGGNESFTINYTNIESIDTGGDPTVTWDGEGATDDFSDSQNWTGDDLPDENHTVVFDATSGKIAELDLGYNDTIGGLHLDDGYTGTLSLSHDLTIDGDLILDAGTLDLNGHDLVVTGDLILNGGSLRHDSGGIEFQGDGDQTLDSGSTTLDDITINKSGGTLTVTEDLEVSGNFIHRPERSMSAA